MRTHASTAGNPEAKCKKVCMIAYTNYLFDGRIRLEAESLVQWGYEVEILVPKAKSRRRIYEMSGVTVHELNVIKYGGRHKSGYIASYIAFLFLAFVACSRLFLTSNVRVIHVHNMPDVLVFAALLPRLFGCRVVLDLHDTVPEMYAAKFENTSRLLMGLLRLEERVGCAIAQQIICANHVQREAVIRHGVPGDKIATVITMPKYSVGTMIRAAAKDQGFRLVNHGTMSKRLGNDLIIQAAAKLVQEIPGFELHIIGGGDSWEQMRSLSRSLGLEGCVYFHQGVPWNELAEKLSTMDAGIVGNRVNAATELMLPSKLIDYVAMEIPAIVPRLSAIQYYFTEDMVTYFEPEKVDSMVAATLALYGDQARRKQQPQNAKKFLKTYRWDLDEQGLRAIYKKLFREPQEAETMTGTRLPAPVCRPQSGSPRMDPNNLRTFEEVEVVRK